MNIWATFRNVIERSIETTLTQAMQERCERLIIEALRTAWKTCDDVRANAKADRLFKDPKPKWVSGVDAMGIPASRVVVAATYNRDPGKELVEGLVIGVPYLTKNPPAQSAGEISRSLWLQAPFHSLMLSAAMAVQHEATPASIVDPVDHLKVLFESGDDRKRSITQARCSVSGSAVHRTMEERKDRMPSHDQLVACVIRQYDAGLYRAWVSLDKGHMVCLGAYQNEADATETIDRFLDTYRDGRIKTPEDILPLIDSSRAQDLTAPLLMVGRGVGPELNGIGEGLIDRGPSLSLEH